MTVHWKIIEKYGCLFKYDVFLKKTPEGLRHTEPRIGNAPKLWCFIKPIEQLKKPEINTRSTRRIIPMSPSLPEGGYTAPMQCIMRGGYTPSAGKTVLQLQREGGHPLAGNTNCVCIVIHHAYRWICMHIDVYARMYIHRYAWTMNMGYAFYRGSSENTRTLHHVVYELQVL